MQLFRDRQIRRAYRRLSRLDHQRIKSRGLKKNVTVVDTTAFRDGSLRFSDFFDVPILPHVAVFIFYSIEREINQRARLAYVLVRAENRTRSTDSDNPFLCG